MQMVLIGEYIKQRRKELHLTQEKVCDGICDPTTLSRIENGCQVPSKTKLNALLQRLGLPDSRYYALVSDHELKIESLKREIVSCNALEKADQGFVYLAQLEEITEPEDHLTGQFVLRSKALLGRIRGKYSVHEQLDLLNQALCMTIPQFSLDNITEFLYTFDEVKIINQIALCYSDLQQHLKALAIYQQILKYIYSHYQEITTAGNGMLPMVLHNYAGELSLAGQYKECIQVCREGQQVCIRYGHHQFLPGFLEDMAECYFFCGNRKESKEFYLQAYYVYRALEEQSSVQRLYSEIEDRFGCTIL